MDLDALVNIMVVIIFFLIEMHVELNDSRTNKSDKNQQQQRWC